MKNDVPLPARRTLCLAAALWPLCTRLAAAPAADGEALRSAAERGDAKAVESLLGRGVDPDARDAHGSTALMRAARQGHLEAVRRLLVHGARKELQNDQGQTAFDLAVVGGQVDVIALLRDA